MTYKDRLTIEYNGHPVPKELCSIDRYGNADDCFSCDEICEECNDVLNSLDSCNKCPIQKCFNKLAELEDKIENGTLIELPCNVGDTVWFIKDKNSYFSEPKSDVIRSISIWENDTIFMTKNRGFFNDKFIRQKVFFTREEAEQALKKSKHKREYNSADE